MACPFFMPIEKLQNGAWLHAHRLPLGGGWSGRCTAPGHEDETPSLEDQQNFCNLGYAETCGRLPQQRECDSIRFGARTIHEAKPQARSQIKDLQINEAPVQYIQVQYVRERAHRPAGHGVLHFDAALRRCAQPHADARIQRMAECYLESYLEKRRRNELVAAS